MPAAPVSPEADAFLRRPNGAVVATIRRDGSPFTAATWYDWDGEHILMNGDAGRLRIRHMRRDPRVSVTVFDPGNWYWQLTLVGRIDEIRDDDGYVDIDRLAMRYIGGRYPDRSSPRVSMRMAVDTWNGWDPVRYTVWQPGVTVPPM
ncbi:MAG: PPOX class F420-dependent oxidoreductase [Actinomycetota bacterium]